MQSAALPPGVPNRCLGPAKKVFPRLVTDFPEIVEMDLNPLFVTGGRFVAVDARLVIEPATVPAPRHLIIAPYPNQYESDWMMRDGTPVLLRPMKPEDEPLVSDFLAKCSEETVYFRYFKLIKHWTHEMLIRFTQNDYDREIGLMAIGQPPGPEVMLGVSRLVMAADRSSAEFAVIVADPWQGKGWDPSWWRASSPLPGSRGSNFCMAKSWPRTSPCWTWCGAWASG